MRIFDYIRSLFSPKAAVWLAASKNNFGAPVLDCRRFVANVTSWSSDPNVAKQFAQVRDRDGREYINQAPVNAVSLPSKLQFPYKGTHADGPIFLAQVMEEKWDMFLHGNQLYVTRSWTGALVIVATCVFQTNYVAIAHINIDHALAEEQTDYPEQLLDFLIKSHMSRWLVAHPLRQSWRGKSAEELAKLSFASFGRLGLFGTFENTIQLPRAYNP
jgi:hypothetical protein